MKNWKVGELAEATGITVRTLHHYDEIGLLRPSHHTDSGHRLYNDFDITRLQYIMTLRQLGLALDEVKAALDEPGFSFLDAVVRLRAKLNAKLNEMEELNSRLSGVENMIRDGQMISVEKMIQLMEVMSMFEKYLNKEQQEMVAAQKQKLGSERIKDVQEAQWPDLIRKVQAAFDAGVDPSEPEVQDLAQQWMSLVSEFTAGDAKIAQNLRKMWENEPKLPTLAGYPGVDMGKLMDYISRAHRR